MDELFEASFSSLTEKQVDNKIKPHCGRCHRYMKYINLRPNRLYCPTCEETYKMPTKQGKIRLFGESRCPLDDFELVIFTSKRGQSFSICPFCFNNPTLEGMTPESGCNKCPNKDCKFSVEQKAYESCPGCDIGRLVLNPNMQPMIDCNLCNYSIILPQAIIKKLELTTQVCETCGCKLLEFHFHKGKDPVGSGETFIGCLKCNPKLSPLVQTKTDNYGGYGGRGRGGKKFPQKTIPAELKASVPEGKGTNQNAGSVQTVSISLVPNAQQSREDNTQTRDNWGRGKPRGGGRGGRGRGRGGRGGRGRKGRGRGRGGRDEDFGHSSVDFDAYQQLSTMGYSQPQIIQALRKSTMDIL